MKRYHVYIMASRSRAIYIGASSDLLRRVAQHRVGFYRGHAALYRINRLIYFEEAMRAYAMVRRERHLKGSIRRRKVALIEARNPAWNDLAAMWVLPVVHRPSRCD